MYPEGYIRFFVLITPPDCRVYNPQPGKVRFIFVLMVEVFKTDVRDPRQASKLVTRIHYAFPNYEVNFDLEDCDKILRIKCEGELIPVAPIIRILKRAGYHASVLPDEVECVDTDIINVGLNR
jgi:hypothetical protein